jgi:type IV secretion system protein VirD4
MKHNEEFRFGSAAWASKKQNEAAGLFSPKGPQIGFLECQPLYLESDAPMICIGGAGSGKLRDMLAYILCGTSLAHLFVLDVRGELGAISLHNFAPAGVRAWFFNPAGIADLPQHRCNPLDILKRDSPRLHADCKMIAESLVPFTGSDNGKYFEQRARDWIEAFLKHLVEQRGKVSLPTLYQLMNMIEGDTEAWASQLELMLQSAFDPVRRTAGEMLAKQQEAQKEFSAIMGTIYSSLGFLDDPMLLAALDAPDFSLAALCDRSQPASFFVNVPFEYIGTWSPLLRCFFTVAILYKSRAPSAPRLTMIIDEAGQLGRFEALLRAFTFGRGAGIRALAVFQDIGQIVRNYGAPAVQGFLGSAQLRQFFGVRDYETAKLISDMLGHETLDYVDPLQRSQARAEKAKAILRTLSDPDPFAGVSDYKRYKQDSSHRQKQTRLLMAPEEIMSMPGDRQILFISGKNLPPILAHKYPYFMRPEMAGHYLPNPFHPPVDNVKIMTARGFETRPVIEEPVPPAYAAFPQYQSGVWRYVEGYRPTINERK